MPVLRIAFKIICFFVFFCLTVCFFCFWFFLFVNSIRTRGHSPDFNPSSQLFYMLILRYFFSNQNIFGTKYLIIGSLVLIWKLSARRIRKSHFYLLAVGLLHFYEEKLMKNMMKNWFFKKKFFGDSTKFFIYAIIQSSRFRTKRKKPRENRTKNENFHFRLKGVDRV